MQEIELACMELKASQSSMNVKLQIDYMFPLYCIPLKILRLVKKYEQDEVIS